MGETMRWCAAGRAWVVMTANEIAREFGGGARLSRAETEDSTDVALREALERVRALRRTEAAIIEADRRARLAAVGGARAARAAKAAAGRRARLARQPE